MAHYDFDLDLPEGEFAEFLVKQLFNGERGHIEVKRDFKVSNTGNLAIEYQSRGRPSGIATTKATWWALVPDGPEYAHELVIFVNINRLKRIARDYYKRGKHKPGGDKKSSRNVLITIEDLVKRDGNSIQPDML